ncbi:transcriptional regulator [Clostridium kluyveri]|uniref:Transcriptional regulator n=1 Tax=Clostridium kluyveri TaxID=1534 RepID=A0A1L5FC16_CLOKL|nr:helix-turn-helix transcriptional regulator [Clostridium kluyveri]APM40517.1 transcriptional regulator [Clostridium kluyveri]
MEKRKANFKLKGLRVENNLKQSDIARKIGISESTYNRKENGYADFSESEMYKISKIFKKDPAFIFFNNIFFDDKVAKQITKETQKEVV